MSNFEKLLSATVLILILAVAILFFLNFSQENSLKSLPLLSSNSGQNSIGEQSDVETESIDQPSDQETSSETTTNSTQLADKISDLEASTSALLERIENLENAPAKTSYSVSAPNFQKQIVYLGSATTKSLSWVDTDAEVTLNSADYPTNVDASFEVGMSIVGGQAWARLINKTTGAVMAITEIYHDTSNTTWKSSPSFKLHSGNNTYQMQVRSSSSENAAFSGARIVIGK